MTDSTYGGYVRHEKHDAGHGIDWQGVAERGEALVGQLFAQRDDALDMAALWKEVARRAINNDRSVTVHRDMLLAAIDSSIRSREEENARAVRAEDTLRLVQQQRDQAVTRAEKAEKELAKADAQIEELNKEAQTFSDALSEEIDRAEKAEQERDEARADRDAALRREKAEQDRADRAERSRDLALDRADRAECHDCVADAAAAREPRPVTVTDEMVERALDRFCELDADHDRPIRDCVEGALTAALTEPPARPEWVGKAGVVWASALGHRHVLWQTDDDGAHWEHDGQSVDWFALSDVTPLYPEGVRVVGEEQP